MKKWHIKKSIRVSLIYCAFSVLWIFFTDKIAFALAPNLSSAVLFSNVKGILFVVLSTLLIFLLIRSDESGKERLLSEMAAVQRSFNLLFEDNPLPMWIFNNQTFTIMAVNPAACKTYGYTAAEFRKLKVTDLRKKEDIPSFLKLIAESKDELRQSGPWEHIKKDGESIFVRVISHSLHSAGIDSTLVSVIDLTEQQRTQEELDTAMQERDDFEAFGYTASHDLKSPLRAIIGYSEILKKEFDKQLEGEAQELVEKVHKAGLNMNEMLDNMLILSGLSRRPLKYERVNISDIYQEIIETFKHQDPDRNIEVKIQPNMMAIGDSGIFRLIAQNLMQNAWKYTKQTANAIVEIGNHENEDGETIFWIKDNGLGIDPSLADHIFEPFTRAHMNSTYEGMGIGLSIVRRAVERHGGRIWVESKPKQGSCFYYTLTQKNQQPYSVLPEK